jgi:type II secretory pathway pseudopilin PulG
VVSAGRSDAGGLVFARRFRLLVAVVIIGVLAWFLLGVLEREVQRAEERAANMVLSQLRAALVIRGAEAMLSRQGRLDDLEGINPFRLVEHQWPNYEGLCAGEKPGAGNWCFQAGERTSKQKETVNRPRGWLIYNPGQPITLDKQQVAPGEPLAWKVTTEFADRNGNGMREQDERPTGLTLAPVPLTEEAAPTQDARR